MENYMNVQKQRKIIMMVNGEKKEIVFNDKDTGSRSKKSSGSKRKSSDRSKSPIKRKKSSERSSSSSKYKSSSEHKIIDGSIAELKDKNVEKSLSGSSKHKSSESTKNKSSSGSKQKSSSDKSSEHNSEKSSIELKASSVLEQKAPENCSSSSKHKSLKKSSSSSSKLKSSEKLSLEHKSASESELNTSASSSSKRKSSSKSKENLLDQSSLSATKQRSSSSSSSSKRSMSTSSQSKRRKSSDESKSESKERKIKSKWHEELISQEFQNIREANNKFLAEMIEKFRVEAKKIFKELYLSDEIERELAIDARLIADYPDEDYGCTLINELCFPKYFPHLTQKLLELQKGKDFEGECSKSRMDENTKQVEGKDENEAKLVPNTEIPLDEILGLGGFQQINTNENIKIVSVKSENIEHDEILTKPINIFVPTTISNPVQCPPDSKANIRLNKIKTEPQPHCSKNIPPTSIKQEINIDSKEYFKVTPQNSINFKIPAIEDSEKLKTLADMSQINKWIGSQNKNHGFKNKEALNSMMSKNALFSLFKCMGTNCCYTTISYDNFLEHLNIHMELKCPIKDCFLNCAYCLEKSKGPIDLMEHYKNIHFNCIYQCNLCFYRAAEQQSVYDHQVHYHSKDSRKHEILECPTVFSKDEKTEENNAINKVKDLKECLNCELCFEKFIIPEDYIKHLKSTHQNLEEKDKSEEEVRKMNINFANNRIGKYQCLECESTKPFGSNSRIEMRSHLHQHPRNLHYVCVRETGQYKHMRIKSRGDLQVTKYNGDLEVLKNNEGILKITTE